jgi:hypothetical protein
VKLESTIDHTPGAWLITDRKDACYQSVAVAYGNVNIPAPEKKVLRGANAYPLDTPPTFFLQPAPKQIESAHKQEFGHELTSISCP